MANTLKIKRGTAATIPQGQLAEPLFTTDTYDLYIGKGSGGNQRFQKYIASGTSSQFLKGDGSLDSTSYQTALTFSSPLVNTSGTISIPVATGSVDGYLSSTDWTTFNSKEPAITAGTSLQYYRGDKTFQTLDTSVVPENGPVYFTEPRVRATVLTGLNLSGGGTIAATDSVLTAFGKVQNQISALVGGATYQGVWNASTNSPTLTSGTGTKGYYYVVSVAGSTNLDGITDWKIGDWAIFNGTTWDKVDNTDAVSSVNGFTGAVNLALDNISDVSAASPTNAQLLRFNGTSSLWENWTPTFEPALTKGNLTEATSSVLTITGGTGAVIGSGTTIQVAQASGSASGYLSSTDWTTFNNKQATITLTTTGTSGAATFTSNTLNIPQYQAALTNPVTGTGTIEYLAKFTSTGSAIGDSSMYYNEGANFNEYTFGSIGSGNKFNNSHFNIYSNSNASLYLQFGSNKYAQLYNLYGDVGISVANSGVHGTFNILYFNGTGTRYVTLNTATGEALRINENKTIRFTEYSSNGFVKTSSSNGTITIDTTSYLPLTGGTLTGALSGTSATFSGIVGANGATEAGWALKSNGNLKIESNSGTTVLQVSDTSTGGKNWSLISAGAGNVHSVAAGSFYLRNSTDGSTVMTIASTGAATFSGALSGTSATFSGNGAFGGSTEPTVRLAITAGGNTASDYIIVGRNSSGTGRFFLDATGAATFSSSVTADGLIRSNFGIVQLFEASTFRGGVYTFKNWVGTGTDYSMVFGSKGDLNLIAGDSTTKQVTLTSGGNLGIGTNSPSSLLHLFSSTTGVSHRIESTATNGEPSVNFYGKNSSGTVRSFAIKYDNSDIVRFGTSDAIPIRFETTDTERMRITSGGDIGIGNITPKLNGNSGTFTTIYNASASAWLELATGSTTDGLGGAVTFNNTNRTGTDKRIAQISGLRSGANDSGELIFTTWNGGTGTNQLTISKTGTATFTSSVTATSFFESSDIRLKTNIQDFNLDVSKISAKIYEKNGITEIGYIAQDVDGVLNSAVSKREDGFLDLSYRQIHTAKIAMLEERIKFLESKLN